MKIVSYWKNPKIVYKDSEFVLIIGRYDHKNDEEKMGAQANKALGAHWGNYPLSNHVLCPCVIPKDTRNAILAGLLHQAVQDKNSERIEQLTEAIEFFNK
jgi:hypothetical protein